MTAAPLVRVPLRLLLAVGFVAVCWMLLAPADAHAEERSPAARPGLLGQVAQTLEDHVSTPVTAASTDATRSFSRTTDRVLGSADATVRHATRDVTRTSEEASRAVPAAPVAPVLERVVTGTAATVDSTTHVATSSARTVVDDTTTQVAATVETATKTLSDTVSDVAATTDGVLSEVVGTVAEVVDPVVPILPVPVGGVTSPGGTDPTPEAAVAARDAATATGPATGTRVASTPSMARPVPTDGPASRVVAGLAAAGVASVPVPADPGPLEPLTFLACLAAAGALSSHSGRGLASGSAALSPTSAPTVELVADAVRSVTRRPAAGPALVPGSSPG